jgi:hypothetical protein
MPLLPSFHFIHKLDDQVVLRLRVNIAQEHQGDAQAVVVAGVEIDRLATCQGVNDFRMIDRLSGFPKTEPNQTVAADSLVSGGGKALKRPFYAFLHLRIVRRDSRDWLGRSQGHSQQNYSCR